MFEVGTCRKREEDVDVSHSGIRLRKTRMLLFFCLNRMTRTDILFQVVVT
jgi:hypothetical protein